MRRIKKYCVFFAIGGVGYALIELLWRGRTHWSMMIAGGICFITFSIIEERLAHIPLFVKAAISATFITALELIFGLIFNITLHMNVWNYDDMPYNFLGQICPTFSLLWCALSLIILPIAKIANEKIRI